MKRLLVSLVASLCPTLTSAQVFNLFRPANGVLKGSTTTYVTTAAASADIVSLWSGTCNATSFLRGDGACTVLGANPTALAGLAAVNGSAATFMRSDGAPALDQSITPTWTGLHTFTGGMTETGAASINASNNAVTNIGTGSTSSTVTVGGGSNAVTLNATTLTETATTHNKNGVVNINVSNNAATNIGTGTTNSLVSIGGGSNAVTIAASAGNLTLSNVTTGTNADFMCMASGNKVTLQTSACTISSLRYKENVKDVAGSVEPEIAGLRVASFNMKERETPNPDPNYATRQVGLIAENIAEVAPECAIYDDDMKTPKSYRQECIIALLVRATQEQQREIKRLQALVVH